MLILMLAEGASFNTIKRRLQTSAPTIIRWKQRFLESGLDGLDTHHSGQNGYGSDSGFAGADSVGHPPETQRRYQPLELPQTGDREVCQQRRGASGLERSRSQTPALGALLGQRRSGVRASRDKSFQCHGRSCVAREELLHVCLLNGDVKSRYLTSGRFLFTWMPGNSVDGGNSRRRFTRLHPRPH